MEIESESAKLSKLPSAVSSPGSSGFTSRSMASRSRIALLYSARLRRCTAPIRPGFGLVDDARSISCSSIPATLWNVSASGRGLPGGGMDPARSFAITFSTSSAFPASFAVSSVSRSTPAVRDFWLWHVRQYLSKTARGEVVSCAPPCIRSINAARKPQCKAWKICASG